MPPSPLPKVAGTFVPVKNDLIEIDVLNDIQYINLRRYRLKFDEDFVFYTGGAQAINYIVNNGIVSTKIKNLDLTSDLSKFAKPLHSDTVLDEVVKIPYFKDHTLIERSTVILGFNATKYFRTSNTPFLINCREGRSRSVGFALLFIMNRYFDKLPSSTVFDRLKFIEMLQTKDVPTTKSGTVPLCKVTTPVDEVMKSILLAHESYTKDEY